MRLMGVTMPVFATGAGDGELKTGEEIEGLFTAAASSFQKRSETNEWAARGPQPQPMRVRSDQLWRRGEQPVRDGEQ